MKSYLAIHIAIHRSKTTAETHQGNNKHQIHCKLIHRKCQRDQLRRLHCSNQRSVVVVIRTGHYQHYIYTCCASCYVVDRSWRSNRTTHIISLSVAAYSDINFSVPSDVEAIRLRCSSVQNYAGTPKWSDDCLTFSVGRPTFV